MSTRNKRRDYDSLVKLLLIGDSGTLLLHSEYFIPVIYSIGHGSHIKDHMYLSLTCMPLQVLQVRVKPSTHSKIDTTLILFTGVGKSCLLLRFAEDSFTNSFITTIGIDFKIKKVRIRDANVKLQIWDTAGQERFRTITSAYYRGAMGILLVYDVTDENSFKNIRNWMKNIEQHASVNVVKAVVGNKSDVGGGERVISYEQGKALANEYGISFYETSAKTGDNVEDMFTEFATVVYDAVVSVSSSGASGDGRRERVSLGNSSTRRPSSSSCCS
jgi:Ras-related protein Rab-8A